MREWARQRADIAQSGASNVADLVAALPAMQGFNLRLFDAGGRTDDWKTDTRHLVLDQEARAMSWDYTTSVTHSENTQRDDAVAGYVGDVKFEELVRNGSYNFFELQPTYSDVIIGGNTGALPFDTKRNNWAA